LLARTSPNFSSMVETERSASAALSATIRISSGAEGANATVARFLDGVARAPAVLASANAGGTEAAAVPLGGSGEVA